MRIDVEVSMTGIDINTNFKFADLTEVGSPKQEYGLSKGLEEAAFNIPGGPDKINFYAQTQTDSDRQAMIDVLTIYKREKARLDKINNAQEEIVNILKKRWRKKELGAGLPTNQKPPLTPAPSATEGGGQGGGAPSDAQEFQNEIMKEMRAITALQELNTVAPSSVNTPASRNYEKEAEEAAASHEAAQDAKSAAEAAAAAAKAAHEEAENTHTAAAGLAAAAATRAAAAACAASAPAAAAATSWLPPRRPRSRTVASTRAQAM